MRRKLLIALLIGAMAAAPTTALAEDADLEARIEALEERVAALEAQLAGSAPETEADQEASDMSLSVDGFTLTYKKVEVTKDYKDQDCVIIYFDYINQSDETASAQFEHLIKVFQNGKEIKTTTTGGNQAAIDWSTDLQPGADPLEVAVARLIDGKSDITIKIQSASDFSAEPVEFTVPLE